MMAWEVERDWWKTLFDEVYLLTDARSVMDEDLTRREIDFILTLLPLRPEDRILDLCGGHGRHSLELCRRGFHRCTVLDYSSALLAHGQSRAAEDGWPIEFIRGDARRLGLASASFDHVLLVGNSLGYAAEPEADHKILAESLRVLCPGGRILLEVANGASLRANFQPSSWHEHGSLVICRERQLRDDSITAREMVICKERGLIRDRTYSIRLYEPQELARLLEEVGFSRVQIQAVFSQDHRKGDCGFMNRRMILTAEKT